MSTFLGAKLFVILMFLFLAAKLLYNFKYSVRPSVHEERYTCNLILSAAIQDKTAELYV